MSAIPPAETRVHNPYLSSKRQRLTNYERANRLAQRIFDTQQKPVVILRIGSPFQQYRLIVGEEIHKLDLKEEDLDTSCLIASYL